MRGQSVPFSKPTVVRFGGWSDIGKKFRSKNTFKKKKEIEVIKPDSNAVEMLTIKRTDTFIAVL